MSKLRWGDAEDGPRPLLAREPVGGVLIPVNWLVLLAPYMALVTTEFGISNSKIDLIIVKYENDEMLPLLPIEVKETSRASLKAKNVTKRIRKDVEKLRRHITTLTSCQNIRPAMIFFFRVVKDKGVDSETSKQMELVQKEYPDILFLWGPLPLLY